MTGVVLSWDVAVKAAWMHCVLATATPDGGIVVVSGPATVNVTKSRRSWHTSEDEGQICNNKLAFGKAEEPVLLK